MVLIFGRLDIRCAMILGLWHDCNSVNLRTIQACCNQWPIHAVRAYAAPGTKATTRSALAIWDGRGPGSDTDEPEPGSPRGPLTPGLSRRPRQHCESRWHAPIRPLGGECMALQRFLLFAGLPMLAFGGGAGIQPDGVIMIPERDRMPRVGIGIITHNRCQVRIPSSPRTTPARPRGMGGRLDPWGAALGARQSGRTLAGGSDHDGAGTVL